MKSQELKHYKLPDNPGVYHFKRGKKILYIGKATSLKDRVKSYFNGDILDTRGPKIEQMLKLADRIDWQETHSVLEALLLETELIKKYQPPYNTREKDDKSYWHVIITDEDFPRILPIRGRELFKRRSDADQTQNNAEKTFIVRDWISDKSGKVGIKYQFGPFPYGAEIKEALKIVRRIFPFRDKCQPCKAGKSRCDLDFPEGSPRGECQACFNRQIGLCPGVCTGEISKTDYQKIIRNIKLFFEGKKMVVIKNLEREMKSLARKQEFEKAGKIRNQIFALQHIQDVSLLKNKGVVRSRIWLPLRKASRGTVREKRFLTTGSLEVGLQKSEVVRSRISQDEKRLLTTSPCSIRIEAYDIAHISGSGTVGAMAVWQDGELEKSEYKKFRIRGTMRNKPSSAQGFGGRARRGNKMKEVGINDTANLAEILQRRFKHTEWTFPNFIVVDGGIAQINVAKKVLSELGISLPVLSVVKDEKHKFREILGDKTLINSHKDEIRLLNAEVHRFAISYHRKIMRQMLK